MPISYEGVNGAWPEQVPIPTPEEAVSAAKRLWRFATKKPFDGNIKVTSGNRYGKLLREFDGKGKWHYTLYVNPDRSRGYRGWKGLVHTMSHICHRRVNRGIPDHGSHHRTLEREMIEYVVKSGWLEGKLRREAKAKPETAIQEVRHQRVLTRIKAWEAKERRAKTALKKLRATKAYYERTLSIG